MSRKELVLVILIVLNFISLTINVIGVLHILHNTRSGKWGTGFFRHVPEDKLFGMSVYEDGSYEIKYIDGTSEIGCLPQGLCQD